MSQQDPRLDWRSRHDERSRAYAATSLLEAAEAGFKTWRAGPTVLNQQNEGGCVGWSLSHWLMASPVRLRGITDASAHRLYKDAQQLDPWPGDQYSGTSVLAGAQAAQQAGYISSYYWCFGIEDVERVVRSHSGVVVGIPWYDSMYRPLPNGLIRPEGELVGGHAIFIRGFHGNRKLKGEGRQAVFTLRNSWGPRWGLKGDCYLSYEDLARLLSDNGEACVPVLSPPAVPA